MMRRSLVLCLLGLFIFSTNLFAAEYKIRIGNSMAADHSTGKANEVFAQYVKEVTYGKIVVEPHYAGSLGGNREILEMTKLGTLEACVTGSSHIERYIPELGILVLPFIWHNPATLFETVDGSLGQYLVAKLDAVGYHRLGFWDGGFRNVSNSKRPITSVADMKGIKLRCLPTPVHINFWKAVGASPTPMDWKEVFQALMTGVIDGQENPPSNVYTGRLQEVQKYYSLTGHCNEPFVFVMSKIVYNKLSEDLRIAVDVAARKATLWQREESEKDNKKCLADLEKAGMKINTLTETKLAEFRSIAQKQYPEAIKGFGKMGKELTDLMIWAMKK
jgi:tripartite ATP-independent transporter DctP family solute receptor